MSDVQKTSDWPARFAALGDADGDEWDRLHKQIEADWKREYRAAFVEIALSRRWERESAETWADEIVDDAFASAPPCDPRETAKVDVQECENEAADV